MITTFYLAFPFYYSSLSVFACKISAAVCTRQTQCPIHLNSCLNCCALSPFLDVALKNNFDESKYSWMEKWIHIGAYLPPLALAITSLALGWIKPGLAYVSAEAIS